MRLIFSPPPPFSFTHTVTAARFLYIACVHQPGGRVRRAVRLGSALALVELRDAGTVNAPCIQADVLAATAPIDEHELTAKLALMFTNRADVAAFHRAHAADPHLGPSLARLYGLTAMGSDTLFEAVALTMIEQQISVKMAQTAERWLMDWADEGIDFDGQRYPVFPEPARIAAAEVADLLPLKITRVRMARLIAFAARAAEPGFEALRQGPTSALYEALRAVPGVGNWTAAWSIIRAVGDFPYFGAADVALRNAVNRLCFNAPGRVEPKALDALFSRYGADAGLASYYLMMHYETDRYISSQA